MAEYGTGSAPLRGARAGGRDLADGPERPINNAPALVAQRSNRLPVLAAEIAETHRQVNQHLSAAADGALLAGAKLIEAKQLVRHGEWLPFLKDAGIQERAAQRYMVLAASDLKSDTVSLLGGPTPALRFLRLRKLATDALREAEAAAIAGNDGIAEIESALDLIAELVEMFPPEITSPGGAP